MLIAIPKRFYVDYFERGNPPPAVVKTTKFNYFIDSEDPSVDEFYGDAKFYAEWMTPQSVDGSMFGVFRSAVATVAAFEKAGVSK